MIIVIVVVVVVVVVVFGAFNEYIFHACNISCSIPRTKIKYEFLPQLP